MSNEILDEDFQTDPDKNVFDAETITKINLAKIEADDLIKKVRNGRLALIVLSVFSIISIFLTSLVANPTGASNFEIIIEGVVMAALYGLCALGVQFKPKVALIAGLSIYVIVILLSGLIDPKYIISGVLWKIVIIYFLAQAIASAFKLKKFSDKLFQLGVPLYELDLIKKLKYLPRTPRP